MPFIEDGFCFYNLFFLYEPLPVFLYRHKHLPAQQLLNQKIQ